MEQRENDEVFWGSHLNGGSCQGIRRKLVSLEFKMKQSNFKTKSVSFGLVSVQVVIKKPLKALQQVMTYSHFTYFVNY